jgi:hypothetical protein
MSQGVSNASRSPFAARASLSGTLATAVMSTATTAAASAPTATGFRCHHRDAAAMTGAPRKIARKNGLTITTLMRFITRTKRSSGRPWRAGITATRKAT